MPNLLVVYTVVVQIMPFDVHVAEWTLVPLVEFVAYGLLNKPYRYHRPFMGTTV